MIIVIGNYYLFLEEGRGKDGGGGLYVFFLISGHKLLQKEIVNVKDLKHYDLYEKGGGMEWGYVFF